MKNDSPIIVNDKRLFNADGSTRETASQSTTPDPKPKTENRSPITENQAPKTEIKSNPLFQSFILSLASSVQMHLGIIPHPATQKPELNLTAAKQTIDILGVMEEKTKNNLSEEEADMLKQILFELRMQFVELSTTGLPKTK